MENTIKIDAFDIIDNSNCNANCAHCCRGATVGKRGIDNERILKAIEKAKKYGKDLAMVGNPLHLGYDKDNLPTRFNFSGGEPVLNKELNNFIKTATKQEGNKRFIATISTNGFWGNEAKKLLPDYYSIGVKKITVSIDGFRETHDRIRGIKLYGKLMNIIETAVEYRKEGTKIPAIAINITAMPQNVNEISSLVDHLWNKIEKDRSGFNIYAAFATRYGKAAGMKLSESDIEKIQKARAQLKDMGFKTDETTHPYRVSFESYAKNPTCGKIENPLHSVFISNDCNVYLCAEHYAPYNLDLGNLKDRLLEDIIENYKESDFYKLFIGNKEIEKRKWYLRQMDASRYKGIEWPSKCVPCAALNSFVYFIKQGCNIAKANDYTEKLAKGITKNN